MAQAVSSTIELVNSVTSDSVNSFNFAMCAFACKCFSIELDPCSDGWWKTWWQMIVMIPGLPVSTILQSQSNRHEDPRLILFKAIGCFEPAFVEAHQVSKMMCKVRSLKSQILTHSYLEEIITFSNEVLYNFESDMAVGIRNLCNSTQETAKSHVIVNQNPAS